MTKRNSIMSIVVVVLLVTAGALYNRSREIHRVNTRIPAGFLYTKFDEQIPSDKYISGKEGWSSQVDHPLILAEPGRHMFYCKSNHDGTLIYTPKQVEYYSSDPGKQWGIYPITGGWSGRYAVVCDNNYFIVDQAGSFGTKMYGPFAVPAT